MGLKSKLEERFLEGKAKFFVFLFGQDLKTEYDFPSLLTF